MKNELVQSAEKVKCIFIHAKNKNFIAFSDDCEFGFNTIKCSKAFSGMDLDRIDLDNTWQLFVGKGTSRIYKRTYSADIPLQTIDKLCVTPEYFAEVELFYDIAEMRISFLDLNIRISV